MSAYLEAINGPQPGTKYPLKAQRIRLGRHPDCDVLVDSGGSVSRFHAEITQQDAIYHVADSNSRNGTYVNGQLIQQPERLYDKDRVQICDLIFEFHDENPQAMRSEKSSFPITAIMVDDDDEQTKSSIMSQFEVSSKGLQVHVQATADAKLKSLMELADNLAHALSVDEVLPPVLDSLFKVFLQADHGFIVLRSESGQWVPRCTKFRRPSNNDNVRISRSIIENVTSNRVAVLSANAGDDSRFALSESIASFQICSFMCAPLIDTEGNVLGAVQIDTEGGQHQFREEDLELMASVASQAGIAIQGARLHDEAIASRMIQSELNSARKVQLALLPKAPPKVDGYEFCDYYLAANQIGGDYYDYLQLPDGRLVTIIADVSGHGIGAALVMSKLAADVRFCLATIEKPGEIIARLNDLVYEGTVPELFVTMVMLLLNPATHELSYVLAGHPSPLVRDRQGEIKPLPRDTAGLAIGMIDEQEYEPTTITLEPGDLVCLFTDGITEAWDPDKEEYGEQRLTRQLQQPFETVKGLVDGVITDVNAHIGSGVQKDDICLVSFRRLA